jgi:hypothetical protein
VKIPGTNDPLPNPELLAQISAYAELVGGIMLFIGILSRVTVRLFVFVIPLVSDTPSDIRRRRAAFLQIQQFLKNMGIAGLLSSWAPAARVGMTACSAAAVRTP